MTRMQKNDLYDEVCHLLTDYEMYGEDGHDYSPCVEDFYQVLIRVANNWEELTGDDDE